MCHCAHFAEPTLPSQSFRRPFNPAASLWYWLVSSWELGVFIGFGISILVLACLTFNSAVAAKAASGPSLTLKRWVRIGAESYDGFVPGYRIGPIGLHCLIGRVRFQRNIEEWYMFTLWFRVWLVLSLLGSVCVSGGWFSCQGNCPVMMTHQNSWLGIYTN